MANDDSATAVKTNPVIINLVANDTDADGTVDPGSIVIVSSARKGTTVVNGDGSVTYTANRRQGNDGFSYKVYDNDGAVSNTASVNISILRN